MERTVGVDLAAQSRTTAAAEIVWSRDRAQVRAPRLRCGNDELLELLAGLADGERAGIDCPFGWPIAFVEAVCAHAANRPWPTRGAPADVADHYRSMRLRLTDTLCQQKTGRFPLSVSMDKLGSIAARWAHLADQLAADGRPVDRTGAGPVLEVYPAGARAVWRLAGERSTNKLLGAMPWLRFEPGAEQAYQASEHAFDALIAALIARAAALGLTTPPQGIEQRQVAAVEGWIHLPRSDSLAGLTASAT